MKNKVVTIILVALAIISLVKLKTYWDSRKAIIITPVLTEAENSKDIVDIRSKTVTKVRRDGDKQTREVVRGVRYVATTEMTDGSVKKDYINKGFAFEPGVLLGTNSKVGLIGIDTQFFYWSEYGMVSGVSVPVSDIGFNKLRLHLAVSYNLSRLKLHNTSLFAGLDTSKSIIFGARISF